MLLGGTGALTGAPSLSRFFTLRRSRLLLVGLPVLTILFSAYEVDKEGPLALPHLGVCTAEAAASLEKDLHLGGISNAEEEAELLLPTVEEDDKRGFKRRYLAALFGSCKELQDASCCGFLDCTYVSRRRQRLREIAEKLHKWNAKRNTKEYENTKVIVYMRHAESTANMRKKTLIGFAEYAWSKSKGISWGEVDPLLSATGRTQCAAAAAELVYLKIMLKEMQQSQQLHLPSQDSAAAGEAAAGRSPDRRQTAATAAAAATTDGGFCIQTFLVSPFTRTLQTASLSFHDVGTSLKCQEPTVQQPQQQRQQQQQQQQQHVTWLVDSLLKEKYGNMTDTGTEVAALRRRLGQLYVRRELAPTVFSFRLVPEGQKWWLPYVPDSLRQLRKQLQQQLLQLQQGNALLEENVQEEDEHQSLLRGTSKPESAPLGFVSGAPTSSSSASAAGVAAVGTEVSEEDKNLFVIGGAEGGPLAAAEKSVLQTLEQAEQSLHTPEAFRQRQQQHDDAVAAAAAEGHLWRESWKEVTDRQQLLLLILCAADASTFFFVSHSNFLAGLDQQPRLDNGQLRPLLLRCNVEPEISPL